MLKINLHLVFFFEDEIRKSIENLGEIGND